MKQVNSPDISVINYSVLLDVSTSTPSLTITNTSVETNAANLQWVFEIYSPSGVPIHKGSFSSPDRVNWTTPFVQNSGFPRPYNNIEWGNYKVIVKVKDSDTTIFEHEPTIISLCRPKGNDDNSKNTYGKASIFITTRCKEARIFAEDRTNYTYGGSASTVSKNFILQFPPDDNGTAQTPFSLSQFASASIPITQNGSGYQYFYSAIIDYLLDDAVTVRIKYIDKNTFSVYCNLDLSPVLCELNKLHSDIENGRCRDIKKSHETAALVQGKLLMATIAMLFPQSNDTDPFKIISEINDITGWNCDCCSSGVVPMSQVGNIPEDVVIEVVGDAGDITGSIEDIAGGIRIHLQDFTYVFSIHPGTTSAAFSVIPSIAGNTKTYQLKIDSSTFASELLNLIKNNTSLLNLLNSMISVTTGSYEVSVDGKCVIANQIACDYTFTSILLNAGEKILLKNIELANGQTKAINFYFDGTNSAAVQAHLNTLGLGTFAVSFVGNKMVITSAANANAISGIVYDHYNSSSILVTSNLHIEIAKVCAAGSVSNINQILQAIIDYLCGMILARIKTGRGYSIKLLQAIGGAVDETVVDAEKDTAYLIDKLVNNFNALVDIVRNIKQVDCTSVKGLFPAATNISDNALLYGVDNNSCYSWTPKTLATKIFQIAQTDPTAQAALCQAAQDCSTPVCTPVSTATPTYNAGTSTLSVTILNTGAIKYRAFYFRADTGDYVPSVPQEVAGAFGLTTPMSWTSIPPGKYGITIQAVCENGKTSAEYTVYTTGCAAPASLNVVDNGSTFSVTWGTLPVGAEKVKIEVLLPNGGTIVNSYDPSPTTISINKPAGVYGQYSFSARTVCNVAAGFISVPTNTVILNVQAPPACPPVTDLHISAMTDTTVEIKATKPVGSATPTAYKLTLLRQGSGSPIVQTLSPGGATVTWNVTGLTPNANYTYWVETICENGTGNAVIGGVFFTLPSIANNSLITNFTTNTATTASIMLEGVLIFSVDNLAASATSNFALPDYAASVVRLKVCDAGATSAEITSDGVTYTGVQDASDPELFIFTGVVITNGMAVTFS